MELYSKFYLITATIFLGLISLSFTSKQIKYNETIDKKLIFGKWNYTNSEVGNVVMVFNKDGKGYRFTDSNKTVQKFSYEVSKKSLLKIYIRSYKPELYHIDSLTSKTLIIREYPFIKIRESLSIFQAEFKKGPPISGQRAHKLIPSSRLR